MPPYQSTLFVAAEIGLLTLINANETDVAELKQKHPGGYQALQTLGYATIWFGSSATISSLILIDQFGELPFKHAKLVELKGVETLTKLEPIPSYSSVILEKHGTSKRLSYFQIHCESQS